MPHELSDKDLNALRDEDLAHLEELGEREFVQKIRANRKKVTKVLIVFAKDLGNEAKETGHASKILVKFLMEGSVSADEEKLLKTQVYDLFKMAGIGIPFFLIPGSSLLLPFLIKVASRYGVNLIPSAFDHSKDEEE